ncbi:MAG: hypothetical protein ACTSYS_15495 [Promethearchaeota archaeon]
MVFESSRRMVLQICEQIRKAKLNVGIAGYYENFEENKRRLLLQDIISHESAIEELNVREKQLKKELKKDKEKRAVLEDVRRHLKVKLSELKNTKKTLQRLPSVIKELKAEFKEKIRSFTKFLDDVVKLNDNDDLKDKDFEAQILRLMELIQRLEAINDIVSFNEIMSNAGIELKVNHLTGQKKIKNYRQILVIIHESICTRFFNKATLHSLEMEKRLYLEKAISVCKKIKEINAEEKFMENYYDQFSKLIFARYTISLGIKNMEDFNYVEATRYFLKARENFASIKESKFDNKLIKGYLSLSRALASDAYSLVYLINSYYNWMSVKENIPREFEDIAKVSTDYLYEWITKQYGFPPASQVNNLVKKLFWPKPVYPPSIDKVPNLSELMKKKKEKK